MAGRGISLCRSVLPLVWVIFYCRVWCPAQVPGNVEHRDTVPPATQPALAAEELITLTFPDNMDLKVFVEYVSQSLKLNILYEDQTISQTVTIKAPTKVPKSSLLGLLESVLKMKGLALVDAEQPGWKRIIPATGLIATARPSTQEVDAAPAPDKRKLAVSQIFTIQQADVAKVDTTIKPFLTTPGGNSIPLAEQRLLIVTDYASNLPRVAELIRLLDRPHDHGRQGSKPADSNRDSADTRQRRCRWPCDYGLPAKSAGYAASAAMMPSRSHRRHRRWRSCTTPLAACPRTCATASWSCGSRRASASAW
jgi:type II secretory pathway component GspD/PulD (secretin)